MYGLEKHHIVFRSQGGLDFELNYKYLTPEQHKGNQGPHMNKKRDLEFKKELQANLNKILTQNYYSREEIKNILGMSNKDIDRAIKKLPVSEQGYDKESVIRRLMGGRIYGLS
jgi:biotin operon repressor